MMSMCCDHRVMTNTGSIGLNEVRVPTWLVGGQSCSCTAHSCCCLLPAQVQLGIAVPKYWCAGFGQLQLPARWLSLHLCPLCWPLALTMAPGGLRAGCAQ